MTKPELISKRDTNIDALFQLMDEVESAKLKIAEIHSENVMIDYLLSCDQVERQQSWIETILSAIDIRQCKNSKRYIVRNAAAVAILHRSNKKLSEVARLVHSSTSGVLSYRNQHDKMMGKNSEYKKLYEQFMSVR